LTPEERAKADKERADKLEKRHADERVVRRRRRGFIEVGVEPDLPYVFPMGTAIDTTGSTIGGGGIPLVVNLSFHPLSLWGQKSTLLVLQ